MSDSHGAGDASGATTDGAVLLTDGGDDEGGSGETDVATVDVDSLEIDVLGLHVDLDDLDLDITARSGDGNLVGNLLSAVAGLLDGGLSKLLGGLDFDLGERLSSAFESARASIGDAVDEIPIGELLTQAVVGVVSQVLGLDDLLGDDESENEDDEEDEENEDEEDDGEDE